MITLGSRIIVGTDVENVRLKKAAEAIAESNRTSKDFIAVRVFGDCGDMKRIKENAS